MIGQSVYILADTFFISFNSGANGLAALNLILPVFGIMFAIGSMIGIGSATRYGISKAKGEDADHYFTQSISWSLVCSVPFILIGILTPDKFLALLGADAGLVELGKTYLRIVLIFAPFFMCNYSVTAFARNDNATSTVMAGSLTGSAFNIVFDYIFMFPLGMGLEGAALATAASPIISILICSAHFFGKKNTVRFRLHAPSIAQLFGACQLGVPAFVGEISSGVITTVFNFLILGLVGNIGVAAYGVIANFALVAMAIFNGVSQGAQPIVSDCYGKGDVKSVRKIRNLGLVTALGIAVVLVGAVYGFTDSLVSLFNSEHSAELAEYAHTGMRLYFIGFLFAGINIVGAGFLSATERARESFVTSIMRGFVCIIGCSLLFAAVFGINGVWLSFPASELLTAIVMAVVLVRDNRRL